MKNKMGAGGMGEWANGKDSHTPIRPYAHTPQSKILAIDYGSKRIGLAISDELRMLARPIGYFENTNRLQKEILALIEKEKIGCVIVGLPTSLAGTDSEFTTEVRSFAEKLFLKLDAKK